MNRALSRLEQLYSGQLTEAACEAPAPAPTPCLRSVRPDAVAQVWDAACRHDPPLSEGEGVDALSDIAEDIYKYAVDERCDIVSRTECWADWVSLPSGTVGSFNAVRRLPPERRAVYEDIQKVLTPPQVAEEAAERT